MAKISLEEALSYAEEAAGKAGVDAATIKSLLLAENFSDEGVAKAVQNPKNFSVDTERVSPKGARGLMQLMPGTHQALQSQGFLPEGHSLESWKAQIDAGVAAVREIVKRTGKTDLPSIAADYNAGPRGSKALEEGGNLPAETTNYLAKADIANTSFSTPAMASQRDVRATEGETSTPTGSSSTIASATEEMGAKSLLEVLNESNVWIDRGIAAITRDSAAEAEEKRKAADAIFQAGAARGKAEETKGMIEGAAVNAKQRILKITGLDTREADNRLARNVAEFDQIDAKRRRLEDEVSARMGVGLFDDPIQWFLNQTILPGQVEQHNAMARRQNNLIHVSRALQEATANQEAIDIAATAEHIALLHQNIANANVAEANAKAAELRAEAASATARKTLGIVSLVDKKFDNTAKVLHWNDLLDKQSEGKQLKAEEAEEIRQLDRRLKILGAAIGAPDVSAVELKRGNQKDATEWYNRARKGTPGDNFYEAFTFIDKFGNVRTLNDTGSPEFADFIRSYKTEIYRNAQIEATKAVPEGGKPPTREELIQQAANNMEKEWFGTRQNMLLARTGNPYLVDNGATVSTWRGNPENPVYKMVSTAYKNKIKMNDQQIFTAVVKQVEDGVATPTAAAQALAEYYATAIRRNNSARSIKLMGLDPQNDYNILPTESRFSINLTDVGSIEHALVRVAAKKHGIEREGYGAEFSIGASVP